MPSELDPDVREIIQLTDKKLLIICKLVEYYTRIYHGYGNDKFRNHETPEQYRSWLHTCNIDVCRMIYNKVKIRTQSENVGSSINR